MYLDLPTLQPFCFNGLCLLDEHAEPLCLRAQIQSTRSSPCQAHSRSRTEGAGPPTVRAKNESNRLETDEAAPLGPSQGVNAPVCHLLDARLWPVWADRCVFEGEILGRLVYVPNLRQGVELGGLPMGRLIDFPN